MKIRIDNSISKVTDFNLAQIRELRNTMSYTLLVRGRGGRQQYKKYYLCSHRGEFPTGLLHLFTDWVKKTKTQVQIEDTRVRPETPKNAPETLFLSSNIPAPYPEQLEAIKAVKLASRGIICAPTGSGKSFICALICDAVKVPTLVAVPSLELKTQTISILQSYFGKNKVGSLKDKKHIAVENYDALKPKEQLTGYQCVIIDEFHHSGSATLRNLSLKAWKNVYYRYGLTATPIRSLKEEKILLESVIAPVIYKLEYKTAVDKGYIVPLEAYYYKIPNVRLKGSSTNWHSVYSELIVNRKDRNEKIVDLIITLYEKKASTLVLVKQIEHGKILQDMLKDRGYNIPFANGQDMDSRIMILEFNLREQPVLIGSSILGEGVDTKPCEWVIMAGGVGKSKIQAMQNVGRALRRFENKESGKVIFFADNSHKWMNAHHLEFCKIVKEEYGIKPCLLE